MRRTVIAGNWKMNTTLNEAKKLAHDIVEDCQNFDDIDIVLAPPFTNLAAVAEEIRESRLELGAQNLHWKEQGAFTGEVSPIMLKDLSCHYAIVGHSERRQFFGEDDKIVNQKVLTALVHGLIPIVCVGESKVERDRGVTFFVVDRQIKGALKNISSKQLGKVIVAYEPLWAIGTGQTATPTQAQDVHQSIRDQLAVLFDRDAAATCRILYGGSVKPDNVDDLMSEVDIDGALVGGASLKADSFSRICGFKRSN